MAGAVQHITPSEVELSTVAVKVPCTVTSCDRTFANPSTLRMHLEKVRLKLALKASFSLLSTTGAATTSN